MTDDPEITDPRDPYKRRDAHCVSAGPYTLYLPANGIAILHEDGRQLPGGVGYLSALVQFAGEVIRLNAMVATIRADALEAAAGLCELSAEIMQPDERRLSDAIAAVKSCADAIRALKGTVP